MTRPIVSADRFAPSATQLNRWEQAGQRAANLPDGGILDQRPGQSPNEAIVKNTTGSTLARFSVLQTTEPLVSPSSDSDRYKSQVAFLGKLVEEDDEQRFAITQTRLEANDVDPFAIVAGVTHVRMTGPAGKKHATTVEGESALEASDSGPCVILHDPGPGDSERIARVRIGGGGGSSKCKSQWRIIIWGRPTSGSFSLPVVVKDPSDPDDDGTSQTISFAYNANAETVQTQFETHSLIGTDDIEVTFFGGRFPSHECVVTILSSEIDIELGVPTLSFGSASGIFMHLRKCCT